MKLSSFIKINPADSVVVCLRPMKQGEAIEVDGKTITLLQDTPAGHKVLINDAAEGQDIIKYPRERTSTAPALGWRQMSRNTLRVFSWSPES